MKLLLTILCFSHFVFADLIDQTAVIVNSKMTTLSELQRMVKTLKFRKEINQFAYFHTKDDLKSMADIIVRNQIIRDKLSEINIKITDDIVDEKINETLKKSNTSKTELTKLVSQKGVDYAEYFELMRESIEYKYFVSNIISPLIQVSESEIKNTYSEKAGNAQSTQFELVDFMFELKNISTIDKENLPSKLKNYLSNGDDKNLPPFETLELGYVDLESLSPAIQLKIKNLKKDNLSAVHIDNKIAHIFLVKNTKKSESSSFNQAKDDVRDYVFATKATDIADNWFNAEKSKYFIDIQI